MPRIYIKLLLLLLLSGLINASILTDLRKSISDSAPFFAEFRQEMAGQGSMVLVETGYFLFESPKRMKWEYREPEAKFFILKEQRIQFYDPLEKQLTIGDVKSQTSQWLWQILLTDQTDVEIVENRNQRSITFNLKDEETVYTVFLGLNALPERVIQQDSLGYEHRYIFSGYRLQCWTSDADFELNLPEGVDIIEME